ncbi:MAG TPA: acetyl-CoA carboxylase carboxyl transferase subunit beta [Clostridium sp.]|jgi:acetyl-CoA carboxylase carboxyl transferase subunit beta|nr:acetyl-CoA carboxylase carboxyltransferase subunit beta [Clostridia bacterium]HCW03416.1 acetyl-CoA carboxylase carboxyl transferase subunit beta [Clostridium sp.]
MIKDLFRKQKYITISTSNLNIEELHKPTIPDGMWVKCNNCGKILYKSDVEDNCNTCGSCNYHFRLTAKERLELVLDKDSFVEFDKNMESVNPIKFPNYEDKLNKAKLATDMKEAVITGRGKIADFHTVIAVMDSNFMMGSMGSVVGEKITRAVEYATKHRLPVIIFTASGGARMQEGIISLMQMAKISGAIAKHDENKLLYVSVLTDPTTGGVTASFAMEADIILAEPGALIGFAGKRVIQNTIKQELPEGFQIAEFLLEKGFVDSIIHRTKLRSTLANILQLHGRDSYE